MAISRSLLSQIRTALHNNGPQTAKHLSTTLGYTKKEINHLLYLDPGGEFENDGQTPPKWRVKDLGRTTKQGPSTNSIEARHNAYPGSSQDEVFEIQSSVNFMSLSDRYPREGISSFQHGTPYLSGSYEIDMRLIELIEASRPKARPLIAPLSSPLSVLRLKKRTINALGRKGIINIYQLLSLTANDVLQLPNVGVLTLYDVTRALCHHGLLLGQHLHNVQSRPPRQFPVKEILVFLRENPGISFTQCSKTFDVNESQIVEELSKHLNTDRRLLRVRLATAHAESHGISGSEAIERAFKFVSNGGSLSESIPFAKRKREDQLTCEILTILSGDGAHILDDQSAIFQSLSNQNALLRDLVVVNRRLAGQTLGKIGEEFGLTRERVRQILIRELGPEHARSQAIETIAARKSLVRIRDHLVKTKDPFPLDNSWAVVISKSVTRLVPEQIDTEVQDLIRKRLQSLVNRNPGIDIRDLEEHTGLRKSTIRTLIPSEVMRLTTSNPKTTTSSKWSDQELLELLQQAATYHFPLTGPKWDSLVRMGEIDGPSAQLIFKRFGSWSRACSLAGVEGVEPVRATYDRKWSRRDLEKIVIEYLTCEDAKGTYRDFEQWLAERDDYPSGPTLRNQLGDWSQMKHRVLTSEEMKEVLRER